MGNFSMIPGILSGLTEKLRKAFLNFSNLNE